MGYFKDVTPSSVGVDGNGIIDFLEDTKRKGLEIHSFMMLRHGLCCAKGWYKPYGSDYIHHVYSFSKSLTATAVGFAEQEGLLSLDEKLVDIFPDEMPEVPSENLKEVTLHHLLCMNCGQESEAKDWNPHWLRDFFQHPFPHKPGTFFLYNTVGTNVVAAAVQKKTGQKLLDYLRPRLLDPLGIEKIDCFELPDGTQHGGGGMKLRTEDMAKFAYFMSQNGVWEGESLLPGWYERAGVKQSETLGDSEGHEKEWGNGYGYQCWMGSLPGSYRADGAFGQFGFVFPSLDTVIVMTSSTEQTQSLIDSMYEYLIPAIKEEGKRDAVNRENQSQSDELVAKYLSELALNPLSASRNPNIEAMLDNLKFETTRPGDPTAMSSFEQLVGGAGIYDISNETAITSMEFSFDENDLIWTVQDGSERKCVRAGLNRCYEIQEIAGHTYAATACWRSLYALEVEIRRIEAISGVKLLLRFEEDQVKMEVDETLITFGGLGMTKKDIVPFVKKDK